MKIPLKFKICDNIIQEQYSNLINVFYIQFEQLSGKFLAVYFNSEIKGLFNTQGISRNCIFATVESLKEAIKNAITNSRQAGSFYLYLKLPARLKDKEIKEVVINDIRREVI